VKLGLRGAVPHHQRRDHACHDAGHNMVAVVHESLERRGLLPSEHLVDNGTPTRACCGETSNAMA